MEFILGFPSRYLPTEFPMEFSLAKLHELTRRVLYQQYSLERYPQQLYPQQVSLKYLSKMDISLQGQLKLEISLVSVMDKSALTDKLYWMILSISLASLMCVYSPERALHSSIRYFSQFPVEFVVFTNLLSKEAIGLDHSVRCFKVNFKFLLVSINLSFHSKNLGSCHSLVNLNVWSKQQPPGIYNQHNSKFSVKRSLCVRSEYQTSSIWRSLCVRSKHSNISNVKISLC